LCTYGTGVREDLADIPRDIGIDGAAVFKQLIALVITLFVNGTNVSKHLFLIGWTLQSINIHTFLLNTHNLAGSKTENLILLRPNPSLHTALLF
jgi:hypothetical protein